MHEVLIATHLTDDSLTLLNEEGDVTAVPITPVAHTLREKLATAAAIIARDDVVLDKALLAHDSSPNLKVIGCVGASVSGVDMAAATARGIIVMNTPGANAIAAGELTLTLMLALSRKLVTAHTSLREGYWLLDRKRQAGTQLYGKTLGLIGLGRVGAVVAQRALAFHMTVLAFDPYISDEQIGDERVQLVGLKELLGRSDYVSLHVPLTDETRDMVNEEFLHTMRRGARLINTAHGALVNEDALAGTLRAGYLAGAAVDVFREEPPYSSPLIGLENVIHTPRIGDNTAEASSDVSLQIVTQVLDALRGDDYRNVVNLPFVHGLDFETAHPYMILAERMGKLLLALARSPIRRIAVEYKGDELASLVRPVTVALQRGILAGVHGEAVNYINAPVLAAERGMQVTQVKGIRSAGYASAVSVHVTLEDGEPITMTGTLLDRREPHIVQINDYRMNFIAEGRLLVMGSYDQPGVIGRVGTLLADNGINIASWHTGRSTPGGHTLTVLTLDEPAPDAVLAALRAQDFVRHAHQVML
ncbi:MAG: phosphoglycerate dehydrogenase [Anaerolineae bacterium]|nr:phosphoglycerate dehydrogenase [Anaerolineae bacterium]